ncbi:hypothetical protein ZWY2020_035915, partial [Hordeum vulgare]
ASDPVQAKSSTSLLHQKELRNSTMKLFKQSSETSRNDLSKDLLSAYRRHKTSVPQGLPSLRNFFFGPRLFTEGLGVLESFGRARGPRGVLPWYKLSRSRYTVFDQLKQKLILRQTHKNAESTSDSSPVALSAFSAFLLGAISKSVATILTYPLIRCKVMIQAADPDDDDEDESERTGPGNSRPPKTMLGAMHAMWNKEGIPGFFKGLHAQILKWF